MESLNNSVVYAIRLYSIVCGGWPLRNAAGRGLAEGLRTASLTSRHSIGFSEDPPDEARVSITPITDEPRRVFFLTRPPAKLIYTRAVLWPPHYCNASM